MESGNASSTATVAVSTDDPTSVLETTNGSFQNHQPPAEPPGAIPRGRKRGTSALLQDVTNTDQLQSRISAAKAKRALKSQKCSQASRSNPGREGKLRHSKTVSTGAQEPVNYIS